MSAMKYATLWCDESPDSDLMACGAQVQGDDVTDARDQAKRQGWAVNQPCHGQTYRPTRRDYCPEHRENAVSTRVIGIVATHV